MHKHFFDNFALNDNKHCLHISNYTYAKEEDELSEYLEDESVEEYLVYQKLNVVIKEPHVALWDYLTKEEIEMLLTLKRKHQMRHFIAIRLKPKPKGIPKIIFRELMYTVVKFCKSKNFTIEQTGAVLSEFYLTHVFFTSSLEVGAEKLYAYFKELQLCHSLPFPPRSIKLFSLEDIRDIMTLFCKLYLRNLPIIRFMSLPNYSLQANYEIEPDPVLRKKKKKKKKRKGKKRKGKKGKKKGTAKKSKKK